MCCLGLLRSGTPQALHAAERQWPREPGETPQIARTHGVSGASEQPSRLGGCCRIDAGESVLEFDLPDIHLGLAQYL